MRQSIGARGSTARGLVLALAALALPACSESAPDRLRVARFDQDALCNLTFTDVLRAPVCDSAASTYGVIENETEWCRFWEESYGCRSAPPACDTGLVDFQREVAIVAAPGSAPNGCHGVGIDCIHAAGDSDDVLVFVEHSSPAANCICPAVIVTPVHVVKVARPVGQVRFEHEATVLDCD